MDRPESSGSHKLIIDLIKDEMLHFRSIGDTSDTGDTSNAGPGGIQAALGLQPGQDPASEGRSDPHTTDGATHPQAEVASQASHDKAFSWLAILAPNRVYKEEVGDALEVIAVMERAGCPAWKIRLKVWSTIIWVVINGVRELVAALTGRRSPHK